MNPVKVKIIFTITKMILTFYRILARICSMLNHLLVMYV